MDVSKYKLHALHCYNFIYKFRVYIRKIQDERKHIWTWELHTRLSHLSLIRLNTQKIRFLISVYMSGIRCHQRSKCSKSIILLEINKVPTAVAVYVHFQYNLVQVGMSPVILIFYLMGLFLYTAVYFWLPLKWNFKENELFPIVIVNIFFLYIFFYTFPIGLIWDHSGSAIGIFDWSYDEIILFQPSQFHQITSRKFQWRSQNGLMLIQWEKQIFLAPEVEKRH